MTGLTKGEGAAISISHWKCPVNTSFDHISLRMAVFCIWLPRGGLLGATLSVPPDDRAAPARCDLRHAVVWLWVGRKRRLSAACSDLLFVICSLVHTVAGHPGKTWLSRSQPQRLVEAVRGLLAQGHLAARAGSPSWVSNSPMFQDLPAQVRNWASLECFFPPHFWLCSWSCTILFLSSFVLWTLVSMLKVKVAQCCLTLWPCGLLPARLLCPWLAHCTFSETLYLTSVVGGQARWTAWRNEKRASRMAVA